MKKKRAPSSTRPPRPADGRPSKLTSDAIATTLAYVRAGNYLDTAAAAAGIHRDTLHDWLHKGAAGPGPHRDFSDSLAKAQAESEARDVMIIGRAATENWGAAAWRLERKFPRRWRDSEGAKHAKLLRAKLREEIALLRARLKAGVDTPVQVDLQSDALLQLVRRLAEGKPTI